MEVLQDSVVRQQKLVTENPEDSPYADSIGVKLVFDDAVGPAKGPGGTTAKMGTASKNFRRSDSMSARQVSGESMRILPPKTPITRNKNARHAAATQKAIYDRMGLTKLWSVAEYRQELNNFGFRILLDEDLSMHMAMSYDHSIRAIKDMGDEDQDGVENSSDTLKIDYKQLAEDYEQSITAINRGDFGWRFFVCHFSGSKAVLSMKTPVKPARSRMTGTVRPY